ncbi:hypothetical protein GP486_001740 [Trichoglossum hirsutum]|uniref:Uncharacterized protein n=1 Tax=Trichoglossum hirsutum TaxID=265104 RepID=A0A9P8RSE6_9PEZI|nr:hypothetical protein GP486_001740 [Trichoglossum hirsutum]
MSLTQDVIAFHDWISQRTRPNLGSQLPEGISIQSWVSQKIKELNLQPQSPVDPIASPAWDSPCTAVQDCGPLPLYGHNKHRNSKTTDAPNPPYSQEKPLFPSASDGAVHTQRRQSQQSRLSNASTLVCDDNGDVGTNGTGGGGKLQTSGTRRRKFSGTAACQQAGIDAAAYPAEGLAEWKRRTQDRAARRSPGDKLGEAQDTLEMERQIFLRLAALENKSALGPPPRMRKADLEGHRRDAEEALRMSAGPQVLWARPPPRD